MQPYAFNHQVFNVEKGLPVSSLSIANVAFRLASTSMYCCATFTNSSFQYISVHFQSRSVAYNGFYSLKLVLDLLLSALQ
jgi:hypothetical protein